MSFQTLESPIWAPEGHSQTIIAHFKNIPIHLPNEESKYLSTFDGDKLLIKYHQKNIKKWLLLSHGLAGCSESNYILRLSKMALDENISVARFNHRNCGDSIGTSKKPYHSGRGEDLYVAAKWIRENYPSAEIIVIGYSLSANVVLDMLIRFESELKLKMAIAVNGPIDLKASSIQFAKYSNKIYDKYFIQLLRQFNYKLSKYNFFGTDKDKSNYWALPLSASLIDYDHLYTSKLSGYKDAWDYYEQCSTRHRLEMINTQTLLLTAEDDPIIPVQSYLNLKVKSNIEIRIEKSGGHLGYLNRSKLGQNSYRWMDAFLMEQIKKTFAFSN